MTTLPLLFGASALIVVLTIPLLARLARRVQLLDRPDGRRKIHARPVPLVGGLAVLLAIAATVGGGLVASPWLRQMWAEGNLSLGGLFGAAVVIACVGVVDDRYRLRGRQKLVGQLIAVGILLASGVSVDVVDLLGWRLPLGVFGPVFTAFFLLGAINSLNLIDGMDGMLGSLGAMVAVTIAGLACWTGHWLAAAVALALAGALAGFLCFNLPPAKVFLGDCGSMLIGLMLGVLALQSAVKGPATVMITIPVALLTLPIFDTAAAVTRRTLTGRGIYTTDRGHLHHCLQRSGLSSRRVLLLVTSLCLVTGLGALASLALNRQALAACSALAVVGILTVTRLFGHAEMLLVRKRLSTLALRLRYGHLPGRTHQVAVRLQGSADWEELWQTVTETAVQLNLQTVRLDVNAPAIHEGYHARWDRLDAPADPAQVWKADIPLTLGGQPVGRLEIAGLCDCDPVWEKIATLSKIAAAIAQTVAALTEPKPDAAPAAGLEPLHTA